MDGLHILQLKVNSGHYTPYYYVVDGQRIAFAHACDENLPATDGSSIAGNVGSINKEEKSSFFDQMYFCISFSFIFKFCLQQAMESNHKPYVQLYTY